MKRHFSLLLIFSVSGLLSTPAIACSAIIEYFGSCDASAVIAIDDIRFVAASDEDNVLHVYQLGKTDGPISTLDITNFLKSDVKNIEADIEGTTKLGNRIYWIGSHGANSDGKSRPSRRRFFATDVKVIGDAVTLTPIGVPYENLVHDLASLPTLVEYHLAKAAKIAPKQRILQKGSRRFSVKFNFKI